MNLPAHAKLTISLRVTSVRPDGYHQIDAEMVSLDLHDTIAITSARADTADGTDTAGGFGLSASGPFAAGTPLDESNLAHRALAMAAPDSVGSARIALDKQIPHGGGLGGGSADAAAVLRWAGVGTSAGDLARACELGADIPFCLVGGRARVRGIGEIVEPLPFADLIVTLVVPPLSVSTPAVYRAWDNLGGPNAEGANDLAPAALVVEPELRRWRDDIGELVGRTPQLAGSGGTWFVHGEHQNALAELTDKGATVLVARTVPGEVVKQPTS